MRRTPVRALAVDEPAAGEEFQDVVPRLEDLPLEGLAAADDVAHALLGLARNAHRGELAGPIEPRQLGGVIPIVLALDPGPLGNERRRDDVAGVPPLAHRPVNHIARPARLVAGAEFSLARRAIEPALELREIVRETIDARGRFGLGREERDRDRLLVHIQAEIDD